MESSLCLVYKCRHGAVEQDDGDMEQRKLGWFDKFLCQQSYLSIYPSIQCIVEGFILGSQRELYCINIIVNEKHWTAPVV